MGNVIIIGLILVAIVFALRSSIGHFKGEGGCCGGSSVPVKKKRLWGRIVCRMIVSIEGMHCENCSNRIQNRINEMDGVICKVNLKKKTALIEATHELDEEVIKQKITGLGYQVEEIKYKK